MSGPWLGFDTSSGLLSLALLDERGTLLAEINRRAERRHSAWLVPAIDELLTLGGVERQLLGGVVVNRGPGSYTGLRIGLAAAAALSSGLGIPAYGVSGLAACAAAQRQPGRVAVALDARRGDVFSALFETTDDGAQRELEGPALRPFAAWCDEITGDGRSVLLCGDAVAVHAARLAGNPRIRRGPSELRAVDLVRFVLAWREGGEVDDAFPLAPLYLRPPAVGGGR